MTNPNDAVGTPAAYDGRSSVKSFNDTTGAFTRGIISGWNCSPKAGMTVQIGGDGSNRDIAVAEDNAGNRTTIDNISESPIDITIAGAPATGNRIDLIVAYVDANPQGDGSTPDNPSAVGLITVSGTAASTPTEPDDTAIRTAITSDGATGASAYYVVLASIYVGTSVTTIGSGAITQGTSASLAIKSGILDLFYPVGSYYETSDTSFNPNTAWGGTWSLDSTGKITVAQDSGTFSTVGATGGAETHNHLYKVKYNEYYQAISGAVQLYDYAASSYITPSGPNASGLVNNSVSTSTKTVSRPVVEGEAHTSTESNLMPYVVVKRWHRTA